MKCSSFSKFVVMTVLILATYGIVEGRESGKSPVGQAKDGREVLLRLHGSNTIGATLAPALAENFLKSLGATDIKKTHPSDMETRVEGKIKGNTQPSIIEIHAHGSSTAFQDLGAGACDIGMSSRRVNDKEVQALSRLGDLYSSSNEHVLAIDGIAVIVHKHNSVFKLGASDIKKIFSGQISDWSQVGGSPGRINVYARDDKSGTWDTFKHLVLEDTSLVKGAKRFEDSEKLSDEVANDPNGIGFIGLPYIRNAKALAVSDGSNPVFPEKFSVATEDYPLSRRLYLYTPSGPSNVEARLFVEFALSRDGQNIAEETGFVGLNIKTVKPTLSGDFSGEYVDTVKHKERLSCSFRFKTGSFEPDNRALRDLDRVAGFLNDRNNRGRRIMLLGFADNVGDESLNKNLSERRAEAVRKALGSKGVKISKADITAYGRANPIASNETTSGRERNRRVELWLR